MELIQNAIKESLLNNGKDLYENPSFIDDIQYALNKAEERIKEGHSLTTQGFREILWSKLRCYAGNVANKFDVLDDAALKLFLELKRQYQ